MFIDGVGISGYKSFRKLQRIGPFDKVNLFIGKNNSGKSNILSFLKNHYAELVNILRKGNGGILNLQDQEFDVNRDMKKRDMAFSLGIKIGGINYEKLLDKSQGEKRIKNSIEKILNSKSLAPDGECAWFDYDPKNNHHLSKEIIEKIKNENILGDYEWDKCMNKITGISRGSFDKIYHTIQNLSPAYLDPPEIEMVIAKREVEKPRQNNYGFGGEELRNLLGKLQSPDIPNQHKKKWFKDINGLLKNVTGNELIHLEIPSEGKDIIVHEFEDKSPLPINSLGTGIGELSVLAYICTVLEEQVICIEEPEIHLHPHSQRKFIKYLIDNTHNQYFIATHSVHMLDLPDTAIFHVKYQDGQTIVDQVVSDSDKFSICTDLGYRASDLIQANCIIWVEGPSDRIYLNHWINHLRSDLVEGLHYSIMFYGGKLLSHLTVKDHEIKDFISLRRLNRNISILIDSDKSSSSKKINETKKRIKEEFDTETGFAWVTKGREVENYIDPDILLEAIKEIFPDAIALTNKGKFKKVLLYTNKKKTGIDDATKVKVKIAHAVTSYPANLDVLDLKSKIEQLISFIRKSNE
ncbi:MAG: hypothetical protein IEMM0002_0652 [bacterium]|nr:MAG: hypothetical protein IEMM0002_0652 [bacterium]